MEEFGISGNSAEGPAVFVSYSWDSLEHRHWVRMLSAKLRGHGVRVLLDTWEVGPGDSLTAFMERCCREAEAIIVICTANYADRANGRRGGVGYEGQILSAELLSDSRANVIPVLAGDPDAVPKHLIPTFLVGRYFVDFRNPNDAESALDDLVRALLKVPRYAAPKLGVPPALESYVDDPSGPLPSATVQVASVLAPSTALPKADRTVASDSPTAAGLAVPDVIARIQAVMDRRIAWNLQLEAATGLCDSPVGMVRSFAAGWFTKGLAPARPEALRTLLSLLVDPNPSVRKCLPAITLSDLIEFHGAGLVEQMLLDIGSAGASVGLRAMARAGVVSRNPHHSEQREGVGPRHSTQAATRTAGLAHPDVPNGSAGDTPMLWKFFLTGTVDGGAATGLDKRLTLFELVKLAERSDALMVAGRSFISLISAVVSHEGAAGALRLLHEAGFTPGRVVDCLTSGFGALGENIEGLVSNLRTSPPFSAWLLALYALLPRQNLAFLSALPFPLRARAAELSRQLPISVRLNLAGIELPKTLSRWGPAPGLENYAPLLIARALDADRRRRIQLFEGETRWSPGDLRELYFSASEGDPIGIQFYVEHIVHGSDGISRQPAYDPRWRTVWYPDDVLLVPDGNNRLVGTARSSPLSATGRRSGRR